MKFDSLLELVKDLPWFDLALVVQLTGENRHTVCQQLHRLSNAGRIVMLRRGMYTLAETYRRVPLQPAALANAIYWPSYLTGPWALSYYGIIPERAVVFTSVTTRRPRVFRNPVGEFEYRNVKKEMFFGYTQVTMMGEKVLMATPEKALVDLWYLSTGRWSLDRIRQMRLSAGGLLDNEKLEALVEQAGKPRLRRAYQNLLLYLSEG